MLSDWDCAWPKVSWTQQGRRLHPLGAVEARRVLCLRHCQIQQGVILLSLRQVVPQVPFTGAQHLAHHHHHRRPLPQRALHIQGMCMGWQGVILWSVRQVEPQVLATDLQLLANHHHRRPSPRRA